MAGSPVDAKALASGVLSIPRPFAEREVVRPTARPIAAELLQRVPFSQHQRVSITFNSTAHGDTQVKHNLKVVDPEHEIEFWPFNFEFTSAPATAPIVYKPTDANRRPWTTDLITLRCNVASAKCQLLLTVKARSDD